MITCCNRYEIAMGKTAEFEHYARVWARILRRLGANYHGCFMPGEQPPDADRFSHRSGRAGPENVAVVLFSFSDLEQYDDYRKNAALDPECPWITEFYDETQCFTFYEDVSNISRCMRYLWASVFFFIAVAAAALAQEPTATAPDAYKLQLENDWVRVLRVHYAARQKVPVHNHSRYPAAYVYLNDAGPVNFLHTGWTDPLLTRRAVKARTLRLSRTSSADETHSVDNVSNTDTDFLRIEFRTLKQGESLAFIRYEPVVYDKTRPLTKVHFDNAELKVTRMASPAGTELVIKADTSPTLITMLTQGRVDGRDQPMGHVVWIAPTGSVKLSAAKNELEIFRFDIRTLPARVQ